MRRKLLGALCVTTALCATARAVSWPSTGGNPQRDGWAQGETELSAKALAAHQVKLLYKYKFADAGSGLETLSSPIDLTTLIGYTGFHQLLFVGGSSDVAYALDSDLGTLYFKTKFEGAKSSAAKSTLMCPGGMTAGLVLPGNSAVQRFGGGGGGAGGFGRLGLLWGVSSDGSLRTMRQQDGNATWIAPAKFVPAESYVTGLNLAGTTIYAATVNGCGGHPNGLYAAAITPPKLPPMPGEPLAEPAKFDVSSFMTNGSGFAGTGGTAISTRGDIIYGQVAEGHGDVAGTYSDTVLALDGKTLEVQDYFTPSGKLPALKPNVPSAGVTPVVFQMEGKDMIAAGGRDGRIYLLDAASLGGPDHHTPLAMSDAIVQPDQLGGSGIWGSFATWVDAENGNTRWLYASIRGKAAMKVPGASAGGNGGAVVAFKVETKDGKPALTPQWMSRDMVSPSAPVTANGLVFVLSTGLMPRLAKNDGPAYSAAEVEKGSKSGVLYILDGATGKELFSSGSDATSFANSGLAVANGQIYFTTHDNTLFTYGIPEER
jgi:outer membrane protein assembly factor BamB